MCGNGDCHNTHFSKHEEGKSRNIKLKRIEYAVSVGTDHYTQMQYAYKVYYAGPEFQSPTQWLGFLFFKVELDADSGDILSISEFWLLIKYLSLEANHLHSSRSSTLTKKQPSHYRYTLWAQN